MIVQRRDIKPVFEERRHYRVDLFLQEDQVAHENFLASLDLGHGHPAAKTEWRRGGVSRNADVQIIPRHIDLEDIRFEVARAAQKLENFLIVARHVLSESSHAEEQETNIRE